MIEGRPRESLVQYENPIEVSLDREMFINPSLSKIQISGGQEMDPFKKNFGKY